VVGSSVENGRTTAGSDSTGKKTPPSGITTNMMPHASASAPLPNRRIRPTTTSAIAQPLASRTANTGSRPSPRSVTSKAYRPNAVSATTPTPMTSLTSPNTATPAISSSSRSGVTMRLSRLRDQVSSMKPVETAICDW
jgi:hypothetical protein